jgi:hypothetical protein
MRTSCSGGRRCARCQRERPAPCVGWPAEGLFKQSGTSFGTRVVQRDHEIAGKGAFQALADEIRGREQVRKADAGEVVHQGRAQQRGGRAHGGHAGHHVKNLAGVQPALLDKLEGQTGQSVDAGSPSRPWRFRARPARQPGRLRCAPFPPSCLWIQCLCPAIALAQQAQDSRNNRPRVGAAQAGQGFRGEQRRSRGRDRSHEEEEKAWSTRDKAWREALLPVYEVEVGAR